jgi:hypothetical protein
MLLEIQLNLGDLFYVALPVTGSVKAFEIYAFN